MSDSSADTIAHQPIPVIGIVGGVGSGKSSVAKKLAELAPVAIINADALGHQALELPGVKDKLRARFGAGIFDPQGQVVRSQLAAMVFGESPAAIAARADLEAVTHPEIGRMTQDLIERHRREQSVRWIVLDAALLLEAGWRRQCDLVAFVDVSPERRAEQVLRQRGWNREEWERREASQWPVERKRQAAEVVIDNNGALEVAAKSLLEALERTSAGSNRGDSPSGNR